MNNVDREDSSMTASGQVSARRLHNEFEREQAYSLLKSRISDSSLHPYMPEGEFQFGDWKVAQTDEQMIGLFDGEGKLLAAAYFGPEWKDVYETTVLRGVPKEKMLSMYRTVTVLHGVAVSEGVTGIGLGRLIMSAVEDAVMAGPTRALAGVADPREIGFYESLGYYALAPGQALLVRLPSTAAGDMETGALPIVGSSRWFAKALKGPQDVGAVTLDRRGSPLRMGWLQQSSTISS